MSSTYTQTKPVDQTVRAGVKACHQAPAQRSSTVYARHPLNSEKNEIRLLEIHPGDWDQEIECIIHVVSLPDKPYYCALSYVWGIAEPQTSIRIDSQDFFVGPNLFFALRRLRAHHPGKSLMIWIDAISINQNSTTERNSQVALMGSIYSQCSEVLVWLGELEEVTQTCVKFSSSIPSKTHSGANHALNCHCKDNMWEASLDIQPTMTPSEMALVAIPILMRLADAKRCEDLGVCQLFDTTDEMIAFRITMSHLIGENPWFTRIWIVQECLLATSASIFLGPVSFPINTLYQASEVWEIHSGQSCCLEQILRLGPVVVTIFKQFLFLRLSRHSIHKNKNFNLLYLRTGFLNRHTTLDVDHIYGILGLSKMNYNIVPDYGRSTEEVYVEVTQRLLENEPVHETFWIFVYAPSKNRYANLPSWVIDWTSLERGDLANGRQSWAGFHVHFEETQRNLRSKQREYDQVPRFTNQAMIIHGRRIDHVTTTGSVVNHMADSVTWVERFIEVVHSWRDLVLDNHGPKDAYVLPDEYKPSNSDWATAWFRTLCWSHRVHPKSVMKLSAEETRTAMLDAKHDPAQLLSLDQPYQNDLGVDESSEDTAVKMANTVLFRQVITLIPTILEDKRLLLTQDDHLGLGNIDVQTGDQIWLPTGCNTPLILRPAETTSEDKAQQKFTIVSSCYLEGFMEGPERGFKEPDQEIWIV